MAFKNVSNFIKRFAYLVPAEVSIEKELNGVLKEIYNYNFVYLIKYRNKTLFFSVKNPIVRNNLFLNSNFILEKLKERLQDKAPEKIEFLN